MEVFVGMKSKVASSILVVLFLLGIVFALYWMISKFFLFLTLAQKEVAAALVAGSATIVVATLTIVLGKYYERKKDREALYREKKAEIYDNFLDKFFSSFFDNQGEDSSEDAVKFLKYFTRKLLLWSNPETINAFVNWTHHLQKGRVDAQSVFLTEAFLLSLRKDLGKDNSGIKRGVFASLYFKNSSLFLELAAKNPDITLAEVAEFESQIASLETDS
jgi:hypothetical protein